MVQKDKMAGSLNIPRGTERMSSAEKNRDLDVKLGLLCYQTNEADTY